MAHFTYEGETKDGHPVTETVEARDRFAVYEIARTNGHTVSHIEEVKRFSFIKTLNIERVNYYLSRVKGDELVMVTRNLSSMLAAGLPLSRALSVIERQSKNPRLKGVMASIHERINRGDPFHEALNDSPRVFSKLYVSMVKAGEESGSLADALESLAGQLERSSNLTKKIRGAMIYPAIVISVMAVIGILMMIYVMPTITATFEKLGGDLPVTTQVLIGASNFLTHHGMLTLAVAIVVVAALVYMGRTKPGRSAVHMGLIHMPIIGTLVKETNAARTARTLSSLLSAGVDVVGAIDITRDVVQNVHFKKVLKGAMAKVEKGSPLSESFIENEHLYPILVGEMVSVGEETGQIAKMMGEVATFYENEIDQKTKDLSTIIEPVLMVVIGSAVGFFALAVIAPIYSIADNIK